MLGAGGQAVEKATLRERLVFRFIGAGGWWLILAGLALLPPVLVTVALPSPGDLGEKIARVVTPIVLVFLGAGAIVAFMARRSYSSRPREGRGWHGARLSRPQAILIAAFAAAVAAWTWMHIRPVVALCADAVEMLRSNGVLAEAMREPQFSGVILLPIAVAFVVPVLQLAAAWFITTGAAALLVLALGPPVRIVRAFVMCLILQAALVAAGAHGVGHAHALTSMIESHVRGSTARDWAYSERRQVLDTINRYDAVAQAGARTLEHALLAELLLLLLPLMLGFAASERLRSSAPAGAGQQSDPSGG